MKILVSVLVFVVLPLVLLNLRRIEDVLGSWLERRKMKRMWKEVRLWEDEWRKRCE